MIAEPLALPVRRRVLPAPSRERWEPLRAGIINLWQYAEQELWFHRGRLMLQGRNGAGKTKVLEVLFPFLFDANLDPHRLSASGGEGRDMRWNLLEGRKDGSFEFQARDSIVWLEFGRKAPTGETAFCTIGARMRASTGSPRVNVAYFLTDQRVGEDLELVGEIADPGSSRRVRRPVSRDRLEEAIGAHGGVWDQRGPYRAALDARLFALRGRLDGLVNLQRSLRRPKLSEKFDLETVVGAPARCSAAARRRSRRPAGGGIRGAPPGGAGT